MMSCGAKAAWRFASRRIPKTLSVCAKRFGMFRPNHVAAGYGNLNPSTLNLKPLS
jgi:hypothetical protein